jgi:hypothetical protein
VFAITEAHGEAPGIRRRVEHYWLCGGCSCVFTLKREGETIYLVSGTSVFVSNKSEDHAS